MKPEPNDITDEGLMARVKCGDHEAFSVLVHRYTKMFYMAAYRICSNQNDAEDIVQDAFLKLWQKPDIWRAGRGAKFSTWFYRVVTNQAIDHMRKKKILSDGGDVDRITDEKASQLEVIECAEQQNMLEQAIQSLPERQKIALNLCFYEGLSNKDAASILGVGVKGLESLLMRAKASLKDILLRGGVLEQEGNEGGYYGT